MCIHQIAVLSVHIANRLIGTLYIRVPSVKIVQRVIDFRAYRIFFVLFQAFHQFFDFLAVLSAQMIKQALQITGNQNIHGRRGSQDKFSLSVIDTGLEEII